MLRDFTFPDVGEGIAEGEIVRWLVKEGDWVKEDQELVEVETDKAVVTINSPYTGQIAKLHGREGQIVKVGEPLTTIEGTGDPAPAIEPAKKDSGTVVGSVIEEETEVVRPILATPAVRSLARQMNVDLAEVKGTGRDARITKEDVEAAAGSVARQTRAAADAYGSVEKIPLRGIRRTVAKRMAEASKRIADVTIWEDADITELAQVRAREKTVVEGNEIGRAHV